jgi:phosphomannomutase
VISYGVLARQAGGGIIITASHNPGIWNGFKYKDEHGSSASDEITASIERYVAAAFDAEITQRISLAEAREKGLVEDIDLDTIYFEQVARLIDLEGLRQAGLKLVVDPMYGAGAGYLVRLLSGGKTEVYEINGERNPIFPGLRPEPIATNLGKLTDAIREKSADAGLATDGDADRMGIVDENGVFLSQLQVFALLCLYLLDVRGERGPLIKTLTTTSMAYRLGELYDVPVYETAVGFKYVAPLMMETGAIIGGEESGGYGFRNHVAERDGILANLYFLDFMVKTGKKPSELLEYLYSKVGPHHYQRVDIRFPAAERESIINRVKENSPETIDNVAVDRLDTTDGFRYILKDNTWLLIRFSGTEPLLRIYAETDSLERAARLLEIGKHIAGV